MKSTLLFCSLALLAFGLPSQAEEAAPAPAAKPKAAAAEPAAEKENTAEVAEKAGDKAKATVKKTKETKETKAAAAKTLPFYGEVAAVDEAAKTITIAETTYHLTDATVIHDGDSAAKFSDVKAGRKIGGSYITAAGKKELVKLNLGVKQEAAKRAPKEKEKTKSEAKTKPAAPAEAPAAPSDSNVPASDGKKKPS